MEIAKIQRVKRLLNARGFSRKGEAGDPMLKVSRGGKTWWVEVTENPKKETAADIQVLVADPLLEGDTYRVTWITPHYIGRSVEKAFKK